MPLSTWFRISFEPHTSADRMDTIDIPAKCHDDIFARLPADLIADLRQQHLFIRKQRIAWLARVCTVLYPQVWAIEDAFRRACIENGIARHGRTETMLLRFLCGNIDRKTAQRWADCIAYVHEQVPNATAEQAVALIEAMGGIVRTHEAYRDLQPEMAAEADDENRAEIGCPGTPAQTEQSNPPIASPRLSSSPSDLTVLAEPNAPRRILPHHYDFSSRYGTSEWYTPASIFDALQCEFDLDPSSPGRDVVPWIPAKVHYTERGLEREWFGHVWCNPPFGRYQMDWWTEKFAEHRNGICLVPDRTASMWWHNLAAEADLILVLQNKIRFMKPHGPHHHDSPVGTHLVAYGERGVQGLISAYRRGLGLLLKPFRPA
jgi:DNA N-6-adenine-methyltransferase (Dam)